MKPLTCLQFYPDGARVEEIISGDPQKGREERFKKTTYPDGRVTMGTYVNDIVHGYWVEFDKNMQMTYSGKFDRGKRVGLHEFWENGRSVRIFDADAPQNQNHAGNHL